MGVAAVVAAVLIAMVLWAGVIAKLARPNRIRVTVVALGVPVPASWTAVAALVVAEIGADLVNLLAPGSPISSVVVVVLFGAFAVAGAVARRARAPSACA